MRAVTGYTPPEATIEAFEQRLDEADAVAVVGQPWSGRAELLAEVDTEADDRLVLETPRDSAPALPDGRAVVRNCQYLFRREIGGFEPLETFCSAVADSEKRVVAAWNDVAWSYLEAVSSVGQVFDTVFEIPDLEPDEACAVLRERTDIDEPEAALEAYQENALDAPETVRERLRERIANTPREDPVVELLDDAEHNPRALVALFEQRIAHGVDGRPDAPELDDEETFLLWLVRSNERLARTELARHVDGPLAVALNRLRRQGLVSVTERGIRPRPEALGPIHEALDGRRLLW